VAQPGSSEPAILATEEESAQPILLGIWVAKSAATIAATTSRMPMYSAAVWPRVERTR
jgi:hypothetical protein